MLYDLHSHSTYSDGLLSPAALVARAAIHGVDVLALTDHDEVGGLAEAREAAAVCGIRLVAGAELSVTWEGHTIHVVGLMVDPACPALADALRVVRQGRVQRARRMAASLAECGIRGAYEGALEYVTNEALISRTHFARYLVQAGYVSEVKDAFRRYLTPGNPGYVPHAWPTLTEAVGSIRAAGGQAVLAHPGRYNVSPSGMRRLLEQFRAAGGEAIEVLTSAHTSAQQVEFSTLARVYGLLASAGSDYHGPGESAREVGDLPPLPPGCTPVWHHW